MIESPEQCKNCLKPKSKTGGGFVTQFIDVCRCGVVQTAAEQGLSVHICAVCRKVISAGRDGSFTQWIFRSDSCRCNRPEAMELPAQGPSPDVGFGDSDSEDEEEDLIISKQNFPCDRYAPKAKLGSGSSGTVYLAKDRLLGKRVAVKILHEMRPEQIIAFQEEARTTSKLKHPNIIQILDFGPTDSGAPYMVLEYLDRMISLERVLDDSGPLPVNLTLRVFSKVCDALSHAHELSVFHRDLKPSNILFLDTGGDDLEIKLIDFGVAANVKGTENDSGETGTTLFGSPAYMSPEVCREGSFTERSEIYSVGCVMFEALTGRPPFESESALSTIAMHTDTPPPRLSQFMDGDCPRELEQLIAGCLVKDPNRRISSARQLKALIEKLQVEDLSSMDDCSSKNPFTSPKSIVVYCIVAFLIGTIAVLSLNQTPSGKKKREKKEASIPTVDCHLPVCNEANFNQKFKLDRSTKTLTAMHSIADEQLVWLADHHQTDVTKLELSTHDLPQMDTRISEVGWQSIGKLPLQKLHLTGLLVSNGLKEISKIKTLTNLDLESTGITDDELKIIRDLPLKKLSLQGDPKITDRSAATISGMKQLEVLNITSTGCTDSFLETISGMNIRMLHVGYCHITDRGLVSLAKMPKLDRLFLCGTDISIVGLRELVHLRLKHLDVESCPKFDNTCLELTAKTWPELTGIDFSDTAVTGAAIKNISVFKDMDCLCMAGLKLVDADVTPLYGLKKIVHLDLADNRISDKSVTKLVALPVLKSVDLNSCGLVTPSAVDVIIRRGVAARYMNQNNVSGMGEMLNMYP